jgi:RNA polymerase sigma-70 factor (ECF subfamily)
METATGPTRTDAPEDADVIARVLRGEKEQFEHLVRRYQQTLYRHAVMIVLDHDVAADMVQDAFVRAYVNLRDCREPARFRA